MSTIKLKRIKQAVDIGVTQPLSIGGVASDNSDEVMNIASNGDLQFKKIIQTNGIKFPATQVPSADPNTLDDYEEGTFTPTATADVGSLGAYSSAGFYTKVGNIVMCILTVAISNIGTASGSFTISGLPFQTKSVGSAPRVFGHETALTGKIISGSIVSNTIVDILSYDRSSALLSGGDYKLIFTYLAN